MSAKERRKGATFERELARQARAKGIPARRSGHEQSQSGCESADVTLEVGLLHIEAKRCERIELSKWLAQARAGCPPGRVPVVVARRSREEAWAVVPWSWLLNRIADEYHALRRAVEAAEREV